MNTDARRTDTRRTLWARLLVRLQLNNGGKAADNLQRNNTLRQIKAKFLNCLNG